MGLRPRRTISPARSRMGSDEQPNAAAENDLPQSSAGMDPLTLGGALGAKLMRSRCVEGTPLAIERGQGHMVYGAGASPGARLACDIRPYRCASHCARRGIRRRWARATFRGRSRGANPRSNQITVSNSRPGPRASALVCRKPSSAAPVRAEGSTALRERKRLRHGSAHCVGQRILPLMFDLFL
jgi:hypothetical protein